MEKFYFDDLGRFVIEDFSANSPFASFLPGVAGPMGIPMWIFYVNRGQGIASFGVESKDAPVMEFQPANKAYQTVPYTGFRTFIKGWAEGETFYYEPFSPVERSGWRRRMLIGANELELQETSSAHRLVVSVLYFTLPGEPFAGLVRQVTIKNLADRTVEMEVLDGLPIVIPFGVTNTKLKELSRTLEAWMAVFNLDAGVPFYRVQAGIADTAEVEGVEAGHFYLAFAGGAEGGGRLLLPIVDPEVVFGANTALSYPEQFLAHPLAELQTAQQITVSKTPCGFFGTEASLAPGESVTLYAVIGHAGGVDMVNRERDRLASAAYIDRKHREAGALVAGLTDVVATKTCLPRFDAYCRQNFLDNVLRGGWPVLLSGNVCHIYSRKHGDLERDYNAFFLAAEYYSQGNGNYRDVNQNRRCDVLLAPYVEDFNVITFMNLLQADGYNPLVIHGSRFTIPPDKRAAVLALADDADRLADFLARPFSSGGLLKVITDLHIGLKVSPDEFLSRALDNAEQHFDAVHGEGYWIDHWTYNLDLIETYLAVYPERKDALLFGKPAFTFYDDAVIVRPRAQKYVLADGRARQFGALCEDEEKAALIAARPESPHQVRVEHGRGAVYRTTLFVKLVSLALNKFATLDPAGMGVEMEAGKPGWDDALNGLPGLFGSSLPETCELARLVDFMLRAIEEKGTSTLDLPVEIYDFLQRVAQHLEAYNTSTAPDRDYLYWDAVATERETYRDRTRLGFDGRAASLRLGELARILASFRAKLQSGIDRALAMNDGIPPTYFVHEAEDYELLTDEAGRPRVDAGGRTALRVRGFRTAVLPLFLEGPVHALKITGGPAAACDLHHRVRTSALFDDKLKMYKVNASLAAQPMDIGRARAFTPGWLENESIWLHMEYKYLLEVLKAGLYDAFFDDLPHTLVPFLDPEIYGRSPLENSSFIVSSAHPDAKLHGRGFVARLSGSTAEFLSMWTLMMAGKQPFRVQDDELHLALQPALPGWLFDEAGTVTFTFLGTCSVVYHNPERRNTCGEDGAKPQRITLVTADGATVELAGGVIGAPYAAMVRAGEVRSLQVFLG